MSAKATKRMLAAYIQQAPATLFLSGFFSSPPQNFHDTEEVEIDIIRSEEEVSIAITDVSTGYRMNQADIYTNKSFKPPVHKEAVTINANTLLQRVAGDDPFADVSFQARLTSRIMQAMPQPENKIRRAIELQAAQVLTLGVVTLIDETGNAVYTIDYKPKITHFPTVGVSWGTMGDTKLADILGLAQVVRSDGLTGSELDLIFGEGSWDLFLRDTNVQALLDTRRMELGGIAPERRGRGATHQGTLWLGDFKFSMWTYSGRYKHPQTGVVTKFIPNDKVVILDPMGRRDATFGAIPRLVPPDARLLPFMPGRISNQRGGMDLFPNGWLDQTGENLSVGVGSRPLLIPTAIDTYGCLDTQI